MYLVKSYFAPDERSSGEWKDVGIFKSVDEANRFIDAKKHRGSLAEYFIYERKMSWVPVK